jgi:HNH endonuclease/AP2 domain
MVDDKLYEWLQKWHWARASQGRHPDEFYVGRYVREGKKVRVIYLHRVVMKVLDERLVDHIDGNRLNNTKTNLRIATHQQNSMNRQPTRGRDIPYRGVSLEKRLGKYRAQIKAEGRIVVIGFFTTMEDAAKAYDDAARQYYGEFARLNFSAQG